MPRELPRTTLFRDVIAILRLFFSAVIIFAILAQFNSNARASDFSAVNFFSYFTIQSNILTSFVLAVSGLFLLLNKSETKLLTLSRGAYVVYMALTGIVFAVLLQDIATKDPFIVPWSSNLLHRVVPLVVLLDWLVYPPEERLKLRDVLFWFIFPVIWLAYTFIRAAMVGWYPYHFLDPGEVGGYLGVLTYFVAITFGVGILCFTTLFTGNLFHKLQINQPEH